MIGSRITEFQGYFIGPISCWFSMKIRIEGRAYSAEKTVQHNSTKMLMNRILCIFAGRRDSLDNSNSLNSRDGIIVLVSSTICGFVSVYEGIQPTALSARISNR